MAIRWGGYRVKGLYDELIRAAGKPREAARALAGYLRSLTDADIEERKQAAEAAIRVMGITFTVYSEEGVPSTGPGRSTSFRALSRQASGGASSAGLSSACEPLIFSSTTCITSSAS